jgi:hypothetical protein
MIRVPRKESQTIHPTQQLSGWALSEKARRDRKTNVGDPMSFSILLRPYAARGGNGQ